MAWFNQAPRESGLFGYMRREFAQTLARDGRSVERIAPIVGASPEEVKILDRTERGFKASNFKERNKETQAWLRGELKCAKGGAELPDGKVKIQVGATYCCSTKCAGT